MTLSSQIGAACEPGPAGEQRHQVLDGMVIYAPDSRRANPIRRRTRRTAPVNRVPDMLAPLTRAEWSDYRETSLHADVVAFLDTLRLQGHESLHVTEFGVTPQGRTLSLLVLSAARHFTPDAAQRAGLPVVLIQCGIHAGEVEGKEAALMMARDLLHGRHGDLLHRVTVLIVPLFNADGNDRIDTNNRKLDLEKLSGQIGPTSGVGTRENAAGINLNRDYMRQEGAEMRLLQSRVCHPWNPHLVIDCHTTNGSIHRFAMTVDIPHVVDSGRREPIDYMRDRMVPQVCASVKARDGLDSFWYGNFLRDEGGDGTGWITYPHHPRFGGNYRGLTNRLDLLLETYAYLPFDQRVRTTYAWLRESLLHVAAHGAEILTLLQSCSTPPIQIAVRYRLEAYPDRAADILTRKPYTLEGGPIQVSVPHIAHFVGVDKVARPLAYAVPPPVAAHLARHGLLIDTPASPRDLTAEIGRVHGSKVVPGRTILESANTTHLDVDYATQRRELPSGWSLVRTDQPRGAIAVYLCEATSDDGLLECGLVGAAESGSEFPAWRIHHIEPIAPSISQIR
jgi:hypothetical protein